jgi:hypothetical protein
MAALSIRHQHAAAMHIDIKNRSCPRFLDARQRWFLLK